MPSHANNSSPYKKSFVSALSKKSILLLICVAVVIVVAVGAFFYWHVYKNQKSAKASQAYSSTYAKLDSFTLTGDNAGSGISFDKPVEFGQYSGSVAKANHVILSNYKKAAEVFAIGNIAASSTYSSTPLPQDYLETFSQAMTDPKSPDYKSMTQSITQFINSNLDPRFSTTLGQARALTTSNLKTNAWEFDFTATPQQAKDKQGLPNMQGKAVFATGKNTLYYFLVDAADYNWQSNPKIWQQVIDSLKIDQ